MPANIGSKWVDGELVFFAKSTGVALLTLGEDGVTIHQLKGAAVTEDFPTADQDDEATLFASSGVITVSTDGQ